jgi:CRP-like cAMP-binding protein
MQERLMALLDQPTRAPRNRLLATLPPDSLARMWPRLELVELTLRKTLHIAGKPISSVYFPETGYVSMLAYMEDGDAAEVGMIGNEGMVGLPILLGADHDDVEALVQSTGTALRMDTMAFREELDHAPALRTLLLRWALVHHGQVVRTAACNGRHHTDQRLARWLLMALDRADGSGYPMTHEFLGMMLGVRRAGITVAAGQLQRAGFIHYERGRVEVTDRPGLESAACECYAIVRRSYDHLLGPPAGSTEIYRL